MFTGDGEAVGSVTSGTFGPSVGAPVAMAYIDAAHSTLCSASTVDKELRPSVTAAGTCDASVAVGQLVAKRALAKGISQVVFDRGGAIYHGKVKAVAEGARDKGLVF